jgi:hypothetical protein
MKAWDVFIGSHFLGTIRAESQERALKIAHYRFGNHLDGVLSVRLCSDDRVSSADCLATQDFL